MSKLRYQHLFILAVLGLLVYSNSFGSPFVYDDKWYILENVHIRDLSNFLGLSGTRYVTLLSFALNYAISVYEPFGYNITNIFIHIINAMLLYSVVVLIIKTPVVDKDRAGLSALPLICSLIFLVHPIETQAVNYITQRFASLATLFYLLSVACFLRARLGSLSLERSRYIFYAISLLAAVTAQVTKEISFTLPFVLVLFEFVFFTKDRGVKKRVLYLVPFLLTLLIIPAILFVPEQGGGEHILTAAGKLKSMQVKELKELSAYSYLLTEFRVIVTYLRLLVFPVNQNLLYDYPRYNSFFAPQVFVSFIFLASIFSSAVWFLLRSRRKRDALGIMLSIGVLWFFITISIESSVIPIQHVIFEHRLYLSSIGFFIAAGAGFLYLARLFNSGDRERFSKGAQVLVIAVVILLAFLTYKRNTVWSSDILLWQDVTLKNPDAFEARNNLGLAYSEAGENAKAKEQFIRAIKLKPASSSPYNNLGQLYFSERDHKKALFYYKEALKRDKTNAQARNNIANLYQDTGDTGSALAYYTRALKDKPFSDEIIFNIAGLYKKAGDMDNAADYYNRAIKLAPDKGLYRFALGLLLVEAGEPDLAETHIKEAVRLDPGLTGAYKSLAAMSYAKGSYSEAAGYFKQAIALSPDDDDTHFNLAMTYLAMNRASLAKDHFLKSIRINPAGADAHYYLGLMYLKENKKSKAKQEFNEAIRVSPNFAPARTALENLM